MEQQTMTLFGVEVNVPAKKPKKNPLITVYGPGPEGVKCGACTFHYFREFAKSYPKCEKRGVSGSASTDHSSRFPACARFEAKPTGTMQIRYGCTVCPGKGEVRTIDREKTDQQLLDRGWRIDEAEPGVWIMPTVACSPSCHDELEKRRRQARKKR